VLLDRGTATKGNPEKMPTAQMREFESIGTGLASVNDGNCLSVCMVGDCVWREQQVSKGILEKCQQPE
jgi:hypothetical protein